MNNIPTAHAHTGRKNAHARPSPRPFYMCDTNIYTDFSVAISLSGLCRRPLSPDDFLPRNNISLRRNQSARPRSASEAFEEYVPSYYHFPFGFSDARSSGLKETAFFFFFRNLDATNIHRYRGIRVIFIPAKV